MIETFKIYKYKILSMFLDIEDNLYVYIRVKVIIYVIVVCHTVSSIFNILNMKQYYFID